MVDVLEFPAGPDVPDVQGMLDSQDHSAEPHHPHVQDILDVTDVAADPAVTAAPSFAYPGSPLPAPSPAAPAAPTQGSEAPSAACADDARFIDERGFTCDDWAGFDCLRTCAICSVGGQKAILAACRRSCSERRPELCGGAPVPATPAPTPWRGGYYTQHSARSRRRSVEAAST
eukprot:gene11565-biopygen12402